MICYFCFFVLKKNINAISKNYKVVIYLGRGWVLHFCPSNVPMNFAYSLAFGLLSGNNNIVKSLRNFFRLTFVKRLIN